jgi:hypothetical protein
MASQSDGHANPTRIRVRPRGSYGFDAPKFLPFWALLILADLADAVVSRHLGPLVVAAVIVACGCLGLYASFSPTWRFISCTPRPGAGRSSFNPATAKVFIR